ncbi:SusD/RagB family nutrient-binding outer membrane lipoprotein [Chitinophaga caeni]|uniref:SusD/RagB family nutrient-binding outer membrane lipoprotein n=1 Tax=Chitinophaga caeni TaxID=2029983 RepID=A0A291QVS1_9BACT|nr:SusD/RagB family nutrient-binding outer membrane lipoprotein [Chitinophaga caeni]ATL48025.1 SusD/RagB family nutrient-binding outer membrane lipoprotein [Chitinophaga caeni]
MKKLLAILSITVAFTSCNTWLDVNDNPNSANSAVPTAEQRLPPILAQFSDCYESAGTRAAFVSQQLAVTYAINNNYNLTRWYSNLSSANWPWQCWYVNTAVNIAPMITAAEKVGAYHYIGVGKIIKAWGFSALSDFYGMMPYDEFDDPNTFTPKFDDGSYIQGKVLELLDEAIQDLQKQQAPGAPSLAEGDTWNHGNVDNWIRLANGIKARCLLHLVKKADFDPEAVLAAANAGPQTEDQSTIMQYIDDPSTTNNAKSSLQYQNTGTSARFTKLYIDYLSNNYTGAPTGANDMEDPRMDIILPRMQDGSGNWVRTQGVDMTSDVVLNGPKAVSFNSTTNKFSNADSIYIQLRRNPMSPAAGNRIASTGCWYTDRGAKGLLLTNAEMHFIVAEIKLRQNKPNEALQAYQAGIKAHMTLVGVDGSVSDNFLASTSVVQDPAKLTLSDIMIQKYIALSFSIEVWCDLRRLNYCTDASGVYNESTGVYKGFKRPKHVYLESYPNETDWPRRFAVPSYEINYNLDQVRAANPNAEKPTYINQPVWWDKP